MAVALDEVHDGKIHINAKKHLGSLSSSSHSPVGTTPPNSAERLPVSLKPIMQITSNNKTKPKAHLQNQAIFIVGLSELADTSQLNKKQPEASFQNKEEKKTEHASM